MKKIQKSTAAFMNPLVVHKPKWNLRSTQWEGFIPFVFWYVSEVRPKIFIDTNPLLSEGNASFAFAQASQENDSQLQCYFSGILLEQVSQWKLHESFQLSRSEFLRANKQFEGISHIIPLPEARAMSQFQDGSIDVLLLHLSAIDTELIKRVQAWLPKMSNQGVILMSDITHKQISSMIKYEWEKLCNEYSTFSFIHDNGLGIISVGSEPHPLVGWLTQDVMSDAKLLWKVRSYFALQGQLAQSDAPDYLLKTELIRIGNVLNESLMFDEQIIIENRDRLGNLLNQEIEELENLQIQQLAQKRKQDREVSRIHEEVKQKELTISFYANKYDVQKYLVSRLSAEKRNILTQQALLEQELSFLHYQNTMMQKSLSWKLSKPLRFIQRKSTRFFRKRGYLLRGNAKFKGLYREIANSGLFDEAYYLSQFGGNMQGITDPIEHYISIGAKLGLDPHPLFDTSYYFERYPDVFQTNVNPLVHFLKNGWREGRDPHPLFSVTFYMSRYSKDMIMNMNPLSHYITAGGREGLLPHPLFDSSFYLKSYPDIAASGINPLVHYITKGIIEERNPHPLFDAAYYLDTNPDIGLEGINPLLHYVKLGGREGRNPHPLFDTTFYFEKYPDIAQLRINPLIHYLEKGAQEGRDPSSFFHTLMYVSEHPELLKIDMNPLVHYIMHLDDVSPANNEAIMGDPLDLVNSNYKDDFGKRRIQTADIIVCVHNALHDVQLCLQSILKNSEQPFRIIIVDDGSADDTRSYVQLFAEKKDFVTLIRHEAAKGYTFAANAGLRASKADYAILLNSDTIVTPYWLSRLIQCGESDVHIGAIGPLANTATWQSIPKVLDENGEYVYNTLPSGITVDKMGELVSTHSSHAYPRIPFMNGFCYAIKRNALEKVGLLDEKHFGEGYGEENDYSLRLGKAGFSLAIADDVYVYHAQSKSFTHERRRRLETRAGETLNFLYTPQYVGMRVEVCTSGLPIEGVRARQRTMVNQLDTIHRTSVTFAGRSLAVVLPIASAGGGGNVVIQELKAMRSFLGIDAHLINLKAYQRQFMEAYPNIDIPIIWANNEDEIARIGKRFEAVVATAYYSVPWLKNLPRSVIKGYYMQDFEPHFYNYGDKQWQDSIRSYTLFDDLRLFTKTIWNKNELLRILGIDSYVVGPSVDTRLFAPRDPLPGFAPHDRLRVLAMIRPHTSFRSPEMTLRILREIDRKFGKKIEIIIFGCEPDVLPAYVFKRNWNVLGVLTQNQTAALFSQVDIFVDFSQYQAMGLTTLENMACGTACLVPLKGGTVEFAKDFQNAIVVDTSNEFECLEKLEWLIVSHSFRDVIRHQAVTDTAQYTPELAASTIISYMFG